MGLLSDRRALRDYRNGAMTYNTLADALGLPRIDEVVTTSEYDAAVKVDVALPRVTEYGLNYPNYRPDWVFASADAPLWEVLWGSNCLHYRVARSTADRVDDLGWRHESLSHGVLTDLLWKRDLRDKSEAILAANLIDNLGWYRPEPEPSEVIAYDGANIDDVLRWLGGDWVDRGDGAEAIILSPEMTLSGRTTGVWPGSILHRVGHLIEVLTPEAPESIVKHEPADATGADDNYEAVETAEEAWGIKGDPRADAEAPADVEPGPTTIVINMPALDEEAMHRIAQPFLDMQTALAEGLSTITRRAQRKPPSGQQ